MQPAAAVEEVQFNCVFEPESATVIPLKLCLKVCRLLRLDRLSITNPVSRFQLPRIRFRWTLKILSDIWPVTPCSLTGGQKKRRVFENKVKIWHRKYVTVVTVPPHPRMASSYNAAIIFMVTFFVANGSFKLMSIEMYCKIPNRSKKLR